MHDKPISNRFAAAFSLFLTGTLCASASAAQRSPSHAPSDGSRVAATGQLPGAGLLQDGALRQVLRLGFAHTPTPERSVADALSAQGEQLSRHSKSAPGWTPEAQRRLGQRLALQHMRATPKTGTVTIPRIAVTYDIPLARHRHVDSWIKYFTGRGRGFFARWLKRADVYKPIMLPILKAKGLPEDTIYLAMIESGFVSHALSTSAASGFWQFISSTGKMYKLRQDAWVDERRDFEKATKAAAKYLSRLYREFGHWHLAWASYNAGEGTVRRALKRHGVDNYWTLKATPKALSKETRHYVPKIIAAAIVAKNRVAYGFAPAIVQAPWSYESVTVREPVELRGVAVQTGVTVARLRALNPELLYDLTPPRRRYRLRVPAGTGESVQEWLAQLPVDKRVSFAKYTVRSGDTLSQIARDHRTTITAIADFNGIKNARSLRPGQRLVIPNKTPRSKIATPGRSRKVHTTSPSPKPKVVTALQRLAKTDRPKIADVAPSKASKLPVATHVVSVGDTLWSIATRYGVDVANLMRWNSRDSSGLGVGDVLMIF